MWQTGSTTKGLTTGGNVIEYTEPAADKMKLRADALKILMAQFGSDGKSVYECADEWCSKQYTTAGLVKYYEAYYSKKTK